MKSVLGVPVAVIVLAGMAVAAVLIRSGASGASPALPVAYGFDGHEGWAGGEVRPHAVYFGAGGSLFVRGLRWASWNQADASGRGIRWADSCVPDCAAGSYVRSAAEITLRRVRDHDGQPFLAAMTIVWSANGTLRRETFLWSTGTGTSAVPFWH
jgi:hypothetical protein